MVTTCWPSLIPTSDRGPPCNGSPPTRSHPGHSPPLLWLDADPGATEGVGQSIDDLGTEGRQERWRGQRILPRRLPPPARSGRAPRVTGWSEVVLDGGCKQGTARLRTHTAHEGEDRNPDICGLVFERRPFLNGVRPLDAQARFLEDLHDVERVAGVRDLDAIRKRLVRDPGQNSHIGCLALVPRRHLPAHSLQLDRYDGRSRARRSSSMACLGTPTTSRCAIDRRPGPSTTSTTRARNGSTESPATINARAEPDQAPRHYRGTPTRSPSRRSAGRPQGAYGDVLRAHDDLPT